MQSRIRQIVEDSIRVKTEALPLTVGPLERASRLIIDALKNGGKVLLCGNGGSAADAQHIAAEFVGRFQKERRALPAVALTTDTSILTCLANDYSFETIFSRQVEALGKKGDVLIGISTSGKSPNVVRAFEAAKTQGMSTIAFTGGSGGVMGEMADITVTVPCKVTARVQEMHITLFHALCEVVEDEFAK
ncbi:MAG: D-sedoheptulose 7-phosphate isomerase [Elusimicrobia bacterium]|nr:D-sedoheptulose 7-phosphate isomerase [Elusimicrobiota bacterium]